MRFILTVSSCFENNITKFPGLHSFGQNLIFPDFFDRELHITLRLKLSGRLCVQIHITKLSIFMSHFLNSGFIYPNNFFFVFIVSIVEAWLTTHHLSNRLHSGGIWICGQARARRTDFFRTSCGIVLRPYQHLDALGFKIDYTTALLLPYIQSGHLFLEFPQLGGNGEIGSCFNVDWRRGRP